ncbi:Aminotransferase class-III [mine drainage metagenome]|uniref:Aminotransferase class-III n=1 Tax=mine drainage metagenome TaxID=410659 RepID=T0ZDM8_9ZZZZ
MVITTEPIPMNTGFVLPEPGFRPGVREFCDEVGALLICDEIRTGGKHPRATMARPPPSKISTQFA